MPFLNFTTALGTTNSVFYNVSYIIADQPPTMTTQTVWIIFALTGMALLILSAITTNETCNDLTGIMAVPFLLVSAIQSFAVDVVTGSYFSGGLDTPYIGAITQTHTIYHYDLIGVVLGIMFVISIANLYRLWINYNRVIQPEAPTVNREDTTVGSRRTPPRSNRRDEDEDSEYYRGGR